MNFTQFMEEWKPFPKDKVNRSIEKKEKSGKADDALKAHTQKAVKNYRTKMTDPSKANQKLTGSDKEKTYERALKHNEDRNKAIEKMSKAHDKAIDGDGNSKVGKKKYKKLENKFNKNLTKAQDSTKRRDGIEAIRRTDVANTKEDDKKQAEVNKKDKANRASAKSGLNRAGLESALNAKPKRARMKGPKIKNTIKKESMNFSEFLDSAVHPLYEKEGEVPKCPPGYRYDAKLVMCVPKTKKDSIGNEQKTSDKDLKPGSGSSYNVWGNSGYDGAGYAWEEQPTTNDKAGY